MPQPHSYSDYCGCFDCESHRQALMADMRSGRNNPYTTGYDNAVRSSRYTGGYSTGEPGSWGYELLQSEELAGAASRSAREASAAMRSRWVNMHPHDDQLFARYNQTHRANDQHDRTDEWGEILSFNAGHGINFSSNTERNSTLPRTFGGAFTGLFTRRHGNNSSNVFFRGGVVPQYNFPVLNLEPRYRVSQIATQISGMSSGDIIKYMRDVFRTVLFKNFCVSNSNNGQTPLTNLEIELVMQMRGIRELNAFNWEQFPAYAAELSNDERNRIFDYFHAVTAAYLFRFVDNAQRVNGNYTSEVATLLDGDGAIAYINEYIVNPRINFRNLTTFTAATRYSEEIVVPSGTECVLCRVVPPQYYFIGDQPYCSGCYTTEAHNRFGCASCHNISNPWNTRSLGERLYCENCQRDHIDSCSNCGVNAERGTMRRDDRNRAQCSNCYQPEWKARRWEPTGRNTHRLIPRNMTFGVEIETSRSPRYSELEGNTLWGAVREASTDGKEFVSPVLSGDKGLQEVTDFLARGIALGWTVDRSCGTHVHIGLNQYTLDQKRNVAYAYLLAWPFVAQLSGEERAMNPMCGDPQYTVLDIMAAEDIEDFAAERDRFEFVNWRSLLKYGTIEIRILHGTLDANLINLWTRWHCKFINKVARMPIRYLEQKMANPAAFCENVDRQLLRDLRKALGHIIYDENGNAELTPANPFASMEQAQRRPTRRPRRGAPRPASQWSPLPPVESLSPRPAPRIHEIREVNLDEVARESTERLRRRSAEQAAQLAAILDEENSIPAPARAAARILRAAPPTRR